MKPKSEAKYDFGDEVIVWVDSRHGAQKANIESIQQTSTDFLYGIKYVDFVRSQSQISYELEENILPFSGKFKQAYNDVLESKKALDLSNNHILKLFPKKKK